MFAFLISFHPTVGHLKVELMNAVTEAATARDGSIQKTNRAAHLSLDGKRRSFPIVPNLLQYVIAGTYYARCKIDGKPVRASLETDVFTVAKLRLPDELKELRKLTHPSANGVWTDISFLDDRHAGAGNFSQLPGDSIKVTARSPKAATVDQASATPLAVDREMT